MNQLPQWEESPTAAGTPATALVLWTLGQFILLAAIWADVQLSSNPEHSAGRLGPQLLLAGQFVLSAVLAADLTNTRLLSALAFAIAFLFTQLAGWRCQTPAAASLSNSAAILLWLVGATCWMALARRTGARLLVTLLLVVWIVGTPLLWYVLAEFSSGSGIERILAAFSPLMLTGNTARLPALMAAHAIVAGIAAGGMALRRRSR